MRQKKVLFLAPPNRVTNQLLPDLGIGFIASSLRKEGYEVDFIDMERDSVGYDELSQKVSGRGYLMAGIKLFSSFLPEAQKVMEALKKGDPKIKIVLGGPHPTYALKQSITAFPLADAAIMGEAEKAIIEAASSFLQEKTISNIGSISYRENGAIGLNPKTEFLNIEKIPIPAWDLIDPRSYQSYEHLWYFTKGKTIAPLSISRGCPFSCSFCSDFLASGKKVRYRNINKVIEEIKLLTGEFGVDEIHLTDSIFTSNRKYAYSFCEELQKNGLKIHWATPYGTRLDSLDAELLQAMEESGCYGTSVGIESGCDRILTFMKKRISKQKVEEKINLIKETTGFLIQGFFIIGYPTENRESIDETIEFAKRLKLDMAMFAPFRITPGTEIADYIEKNEPESAPRWDNQTLEKLFYIPKGMTREEIVSLHKKAYREFYIRPAVILNFIRLTRSRKQVGMLFNKVRSRLFRR